MTPQRIWTFTRRWLWLLVVATLLAAVASYVVSSRLPKVYEGSVKLLVTPGQPGSGASSYNDVLAAERLTRTYAEVLRTLPVVETAARRAGINLPYESLISLITVAPVRDTQLVQVTARGAEPEAAASFANQLASVFIEQTQATQSGRFAASKDSLGKQVDQLATDIAGHTRDVDALRVQAASATRDGELTRVQSELVQLQQSYGTAVRAYEDVRMSEARSSDLLSVVEPASPSTNPVQPRMLLNVVLAAVVGLLIALGGVFLVEYLDDRLLSPERLRHFTGLNALGSIALLPDDKPQTIDRLPTPSPRTDGVEQGYGYGYGYGGPSIAEAFRLLRANLQFSAIERPLRTLLVTSAEAGDGKSTTAANLAIVMAQAGQKVILVDADLRRPTQHGLFDVTNRIGLTSLIVDGALDVESAMVTTRVEGLRLLTSGPLPPNPSELLASQRMQARLGELAKLADLVVVDSPPVLPVSDPVVLSGLADGTLIVVNTQHTRGQHAADAVATLRSAGANLLGCVLNRVARRRGSYYGYYAPKHKGSPSTATATQVR